MVELTLQNAKDFSDSQMQKITDESFRSLIITHSVIVAEMAILLSKGRFKEDFYRITGLVHDVGYSIEKDNHAKHSLTLLQEAGFIISPELEDCILNHGSKMRPITPEGKFFQLADKLSMFQLDVVRFWLKKFDDPFSAEFLDLIHKKVTKLDVLFHK